MRVDFDAALACERVAQDASVLTQEVGVCVAVLAEQLRRAHSVTISPDGVYCRDDEAPP